MQTDFTDRPAQLASVLWPIASTNVLAPASAAGACCEVEELASVFQTEASSLVDFDAEVCPTAAASSASNSQRSLVLSATKHPDRELAKVGISAIAGRACIGARFA